LGKAR
jgi:hypothetical protein